MRNGTASWPLDDEFLIEIRLKGIVLVGVKVRETGDIFVTHLNYALDRTKAPTVYDRGLPARCLPLTFFKRQPGKLKLRLNS